MERLLAEGSFYKATSVSDIVVQRLLRLYATRFETSKIDGGVGVDSGKRVWYFDPNCTLFPSNAEDIKARKVRQRPKSTWTMVAALTTDEWKMLYTFKLLWPSTWFYNGYSKYVFGFETLAQAKTWHGLIENTLKSKRASKSGLAITTPLAKPISESSSPTPVSTLYPSTLGIHQSSREITQRQSDTGQRPSDAAQRSSETGQRGGLEQSSAGVGTANLQVPVAQAESIITEDSSADEIEHRDEPSDAVSSTERWIPYKHSNGLAVYRRKSPDSGIGGLPCTEYMVSCQVRGTPKECVDVLLDNSSMSTILGPAQDVQLLDHSNLGSQSTDVLRILIEAAGFTGEWCAPREFIVKRISSYNDNGYHMVIFGSNHDMNFSEDQRPRNTQKHSWWQKPVLATAHGGYTFVPLSSHRFDCNQSPECLITCVIQVDLGGPLSPNSYSRPLVSFLGFQEDFMKRILMSVMLIKDQVEYRRYSLPPFTLCPKQPQSEITADGLDALASPDASGPALDISSLPIALSPTNHGLPPVGSPTLELPDMSSSAARRPGHQRTATAIMRSSRNLLWMRNNAEAKMASRVQRSVLGAVPELPNNSNKAPPKNPPDPSSEMVAEGEEEGTGDFLQRMRQLATCDPRFWLELHVPGADAPFNVRGPTYLKDRRKIPAGTAAFCLSAVELLVLDKPENRFHVARFLPSIRQGGAPFSLVLSWVMPGNPLLTMVFIFSVERHPDSLGVPPARPMEEKHDWQPFDFVLHKFWNGTDQERNSMMKMVPHIAQGSWVVKQSVGTVPVIVGTRLQCKYFKTARYLEMDVDISANPTANFITGKVRTCTKSLAVDMAFVLEGKQPWELPEVLIGAVRMPFVDLTTAKTIDMTQELPMMPATPSSLLSQRHYPSSQCLTTGSGLPATVSKITGNVPRNSSPM